MSGASTHRTREAADKAARKRGACTVIMAPALARGERVHRTDALRYEQRAQGELSLSR